MIDPAFDLKTLIAEQKEAEARQAAIEEQQRIKEEQLQIAEEDKIERAKRAQYQKELDAIRQAELELAQQQAKERTASRVAEEIYNHKSQIVFSEKIFAEICKRIADGEMLSTICKDVTMPHRSQVIEWFDDPASKELQTQYAKACGYRHDKFADELITIADDSSNDFIDKVNSKTKEEFRAFDPENLGRSKLRIETRLRYLKAYNPERWGDSPDNAAAHEAAGGGIGKVIINLIQAAPLPQQAGDNVKLIENNPGIEVRASRTVKKVA